LKTAAAWMQILNFKPTKASKGWYCDGHERADIVQYRNDYFLPIMEKLENRMTWYEGADMENEIKPVLLNNEKEVVLITHDESTFYSNEGIRIFWMENGKKKLLPKSKGTSLMVSGFICQCH
jgi:hypothetical protein